MAEEDKNALGADLKQPQIREINMALSTPVNYTNAVLVSVSVTEIQLTTTINGRPTQTIAMPFPTAKSLILAIEHAIKDYEGKTGTKISELNDLGKLLNKK